VVGLSFRVSAIVCASISNGNPVLYTQRRWPLARGRTVHSGAGPSRPTLADRFSMAREKERERMKGSALSLFSEGPGDKKEERSPLSLFFLPATKCHSHVIRNGKTKKSFFPFLFIQFEILVIRRSFCYIFVAIDIAKCYSNFSPIPPPKRD